MLQEHSVAQRLCALMSVRIGDGRTDPFLVRAIGSNQASTRTSSGGIKQTPLKKTIFKCSLIWIKKGKYDTRCLGKRTLRHCVQFVHRHADTTNCYSDDHSRCRIRRHGQDHKALGIFGGLVPIQDQRPTPACPRPYLIAPLARIEAAQHCTPCISEMQGTGVVQLRQPRKASAGVWLGSLCATWSRTQIPQHARQGIMQLSSRRR
jgi:hypothetical protein